jgi:hypothetical protein
VGVGIGRRLQHQVEQPHVLLAAVIKATGIKLD